MRAELDVCQKLRARQTHAARRIDCRRRDPRPAPRWYWRPPAATSTETVRAEPERVRCRGFRSRRQRRTAAASAPSGTMRMPNRAMEGIVWIRFSVPNVPARNRGTRWQRMPSGTATTTAAATGPSARNTCWRASRCKATGVDLVLAHHRQMVEDARGKAAPAAAAKSTRNSTRIPAPGAGE